MMTSSQLFDLSKAKKMATHTGPRGGRYYISESGEKIYVGKEAGVKVAPGPVDPKLQGEMHARTPRHVINWPTSRTVTKIAQEKWPAYVCRSCRAPVVPHHSVGVMTGIHTETHGVPEAKVITEEKEGVVTVKRKYEKVGETVRVMTRKPGEEKFRVEYGWKPEWVATRLCDKCYEKKAPAYEKRRQRKEEGKVGAHIEAGMQHHRQMLTRQRESERAMKKIKKEASKRKKIKKSVNLWVAL
jgi:hypothetical protein